MLLTLEIDGRELVTTEDHPFWSVTDQTWERADDLQVGEKVLSADGTRHLVTAPIDLATAYYDQAFDLTVAGIHTFHVLTDPDRGPPVDALVHNCNGANCGGAGGQACKIDLTLGVGGPYAREGVALVDGDIDASGVRDMVNESGDRNGCHTCGVRSPGTDNGEWIPDHNPPTGLVSDGTQQTAHPHCGPCARRQGGVVSQVNQNAKTGREKSF